jgi:hypothetical protein
MMKKIPKKNLNLYFQKYLLSERRCFIHAKIGQRAKGKGQRAMAI